MTDENPFLYAIIFLKVINMKDFLNNIRKVEKKDSLKNKIMYGLLFLIRLLYNNHKLGK